MQPDTVYGPGGVFEAVGHVAAVAVPAYPVAHSRPVTSKLPDDRSRLPSTTLVKSYPDEDGRVQTFGLQYIKV